jgi:predicted RNase H-like HicB family nuclease
MPLSEVTFVIHRAEEGGFWAEAEGLSITTQGDNLDELAVMINDAVAGYFFDAPQDKPQSICWRFADGLAA